MLRKFSMLAISAASAFAMHGAEININDKDLQVGLQLDMGQYNPTVEPDTTFVGLSYLKVSDEHANPKIDTSGYYSASFLMKKEINNSGLFFGIGMKANYTLLGDESFIAVPLGLEGSLKLPVDLPLMISAGAYYAPESLAFSDAESFLETNFNVSLEIIDRGSLIAGYRKIDTNIKVKGVSSNITYNKSGYFGFRFNF